MQAHGDFEINVESHIESHIVHVHVYTPSNIEGTMELCRSIEQACSRLDTWVLYMHVSKNTGGSFEAIEYANQFLLKLPSLGCIAYAIQVSNVLVKDFANNAAPNMAIPFLASSDTGQLDEFVKSFTL